MKYLRLRFSPFRFSVVRRMVVVHCVRRVLNDATTINTLIKFFVAFRLRCDGTISINAEFSSSMSMRNICGKLITQPEFDAGAKHL